MKVDDKTVIFVVWPEFGFKRFNKENPITLNQFQWSKTKDKQWNVNENCISFHSSNKIRKLKENVSHIKMYYRIFHSLAVENPTSNTILSVYPNLAKLQRIWKVVCVFVSFWCQNVADARLSAVDFTHKEPYEMFLFGFVSKIELH